MRLMLPLLLAFSAGSTQELCPPASEGALMMVEAYLVSDRDADRRAKLDITIDEAESLTTVTDASTCDLIRLMAESQGYNLDSADMKWAFVQTDHHFFLVAGPIPRTDGKLDLGLYPVVIMDRSYNVRHAFMR
jgi:hypothetical protein